MKVKSESEVAQSCPTPRDPMDCSLSGSSVHGIFQARVLEWGAIAFSKIKQKNYDLIYKEFSIVVIYGEVTKHDHEFKCYNLSLKKFKPDKTSWYLYQSLLYSWNFSVFFKMRVCVLSRFRCRLWPCRLWPTRLLCPWDFPGKILEWVAMLPPGDLPDAGIEPWTLMSPIFAGRLFTVRGTWEAPHEVCPPYFALPSSTFCSITFSPVSRCLSTFMFEKLRFFP